MPKPLPHGTGKIDWEDDACGHHATPVDPPPTTSTTAHPWENPAVFAVGKTPPHAPLYPQADATAALAPDPPTPSPWCICLDGRWKFQLIDQPLAAPANFATPKFDDSAWPEIQVPGHWQLQGFGHPIYTNIQYPFPPTPPRVPAANPTGLYRTTFSLPPNWANLPVLITFEGVDSAFELWLNGQPVGYSQVSRCPAEFNLTAFLQPGQNHLAARVCQWSDGTYLEDQDMWWLSGIFRTVWLRAETQLHLRDVILHPNLANDLNSATLNLELHLQNLAAPGTTNGSLQIALLDPNHQPAAAIATLDIHLDDRQTDVRQLEFTLEKPAPWTAETPNLYTLLITLDHNAQQRSYRLQCGFRTVAIANGQLLINGRPVRLHGVNRHEFNPRRGRLVDEADMLVDLRLLKQHNFNAVRTSHYPNHPRWLELCDQFGLYVIAEADLETHGLQDTLSNDPTWLPAYLDRAERLVGRDRNHPSVIAWSLGNESGHGPNPEAMAARIRTLDPTRPINYHHAGTATYVDWVTMHYPTLQNIRDFLANPDTQGRPILLEEYGHVTGNALGNLAEYWQLIDSEPRLIGGFIWEWCDQGLLKKQDNREIYAYGGDFGDQPNDGKWCIDGLVLPDRTPKPALLEAKRVHQPVAFHLDHQHPGRLLLHNRRHHASLADLTGHWQVLVDGLPVDNGTFAVPNLPPGDWGHVDLPGTACASHPGREALLELAMRLHANTIWADAGHEVAWEQIPLRTETTPPSPNRHRPKLSLHPSTTHLTMQADQLCWSFERATGELVSLDFPGGNLPLRGPQLAIWRAPLDNDQPFLKDWLAAGYDRLACQNVDCQTYSDAGIVLNRHWGPAPDAIRFAEKLQAALSPTGALHLFHTTTPIADNLPTLPRLGLRFSLPNTCNQVRWYGRGPHECLCDRRLGARLAIHAATVDQLEVPYIVPQEHGMRCDLRWLEIRLDETKTLRLAASEPFSFSLRRHTSEQLTKARHCEELVANEYLELCIDYRHAGTGNTSLRAERLPKYQIPPNLHSWLLTLELLDSPLPSSVFRPPSSVLPTSDTNSNPLA